jgi:hypothetical protein
VTLYSPAARQASIARFPALVASLLIVAGISGCAHPRTIIVVCRSMAFFVAGDPTPNPAITVHTGETVALELRNEDGPGILHDLAIDPLNVATPLLLPGQVARVTFTAPGRPGSFDYYCRPHALTMRGVLNVVAP